MTQPLSPWPTSSAPVSPPSASGRPDIGSPQRLSWTGRLSLVIGALLSLVVSCGLGWGTIQIVDALDSGGTTGWDGGLLTVAAALYLGGGVALVSYLGLCTLTVWTVVHDPDRRTGPLLAMIVGPLLVTLVVLQTVLAG